MENSYRERLNIATMLPSYLVSQLDTAKKMFATELSRLKTKAIDYYLLHMLTDFEMFQRMKDLKNVRRTF
jgi:hypothetical protein